MSALEAFEEPLDFDYPELDDSAVNWQDATCRIDSDVDGEMTALFFSEQLDDIRLAKAICAGCPLQSPCLEGALSRQEPWGVWGGELFVKGRIIAQKRKRGRPRKDSYPTELAG